MGTMINTQNYALQNPSLQNLQTWPSLNSQNFNGLLNANNINIGGLLNGSNNGYINQSGLMAPNLPAQQNSSSNDTSMMMSILMALFQALMPDNNTTQTTSVEQTGDSSEIASLKDEIASLKEQLANNKTAAPAAPTTPPPADGSENDKKEPDAGDIALNVFDPGGLLHKKEGGGGLLGGLFG